MGKMLVYAGDFSADKVIRASDFNIVSPNDGLSPQEIRNLSGKKLSKDVKLNDVVTIEDFHI